MEGLHACVPERKTTYADACFGEYRFRSRWKETGEQLPRMGIG